MTWLDRVIEPNAVGGGITHRDAIKSQCGALAVTYVETAIEATQVAAFEIVSENYVSRINFDDLIADRMRGVELLKEVWDALQEDDMAKAKNLMLTGTNFNILGTQA